jgi:ribonuclease HI
MTSKKFYAVAKGRKTGVYNNWLDAKAQIEGFSGALYKGFSTHKMAEEWLKHPGYGTGAGTSRSGSLNTPSNRNNTSSNIGGVMIYSDGGCINNPGPGGYGVVQIYGDIEKELTGGFRFTTNNRMELMGVIVALNNLEYRDVHITIHTDSSYVVNGIEKGWAKKWKKNNWLKSNKEPVLNPDLWKELLNLIESLNVKFEWIKGHAGHPLNERCDELAVSSARKGNLPEDTGYKGN